MPQQNRSMVDGHMTADDALTLLSPYMVHRHKGAEDAARLVIDGLYEGYRPRQDTDRRFARSLNEDIPGLSDAELWRETEKAKFLAVWHEDRAGWLANRYAALEAERVRRGR